MYESHGQDHGLCRERWHNSGFSNDYGLATTGKGEMMAKKITAVVFDFNNTISPDNFLESLQKYENELGMSAEDLLKSYVNSGLLDLVMLGEISEAEFWTALSLRMDIPGEVLEKVAKEIKESRQLDDEVMNIVRGLRKEGCQLALLTDNVQETFELWVNKYQLEDYFDVIVNSAHYGLLKTDPEIYYLTLHNLSVRPEETLFIDNDRANGELAQKLGMKTILFKDAEQLAKALQYYELPNSFPTSPLKIHHNRQ